MNGPSNLAIIENEGPNYLGKYLLSHLKTATSADIAVAFVTATGLAQIRPALQKLACGGHVRLLTGLYQWFTEPTALKQLLELAEGARGRFQVRLSRNKHFHWKSYHIHGARSSTVIVGSSNLTSDGLLSSGELNLSLSLSKASAIPLCKAFEEEWIDSVDLTNKQIKLYQQLRPTLAGKQQYVPLSKVLGRPMRQAKQPALCLKPNEGPQLWQDYASRYASAKTTNLIEESTNWDQKKYLWYTGEKRHVKGDRLVMFDFCRNRVMLASITGTTAVETPDGRYFTAYRKEVGTSERVLCPRLWRSLRQAGVLTVQEDARKVRKLRQRQFENLVNAIGF